MGMESVKKKKKANSRIQRPAAVTVPLEGLFQAQAE